MSTVVVSGSFERKPEYAPVPPKGTGKRVLTTINYGMLFSVLRYGTYVGKEPYPYSFEEGGSQWSRGKGTKNPKIIYDNGRVIWGCECWWHEVEEDEPSPDGIFVTTDPTWTQEQKDHVVACIRRDYGDKAADRLAESMKDG